MPTSGPSYVYTHTRAMILKSFATSQIPESITLIDRTTFLGDVAMMQHNTVWVSCFSDLKSVPLDQIRTNPIALRTVDPESEDYQGLVDSIRQKGFLGAITVRPVTDPDTNEEFFQIIDGLHRFTAAKDAGLGEINVSIIALEDDQVLEAQIMANIHKVETKPMEYSKQLRKILTRNPLMTEAELATNLGKSTQWIKERLGLNKIVNENISGLIDEGKISLANAYAMAKLPAEEQTDWIDRAITESPDEFIPAVNKRAKELSDAKRQGKDAATAEFDPTPHMQKLKDVKDELAAGTVGKAMVKKNGATDAAAGFALAVAWVLHMDPDSQDEQKVKQKQRESDRADAKKKRDVERTQAKAEKKAQEAKDAAAEAEKATASVN